MTARLDQQGGTAAQHLAPCAACGGGGLVPTMGCTCDGERAHLHTRDLHYVRRHRASRLTDQYRGDRRVACGTMPRSLKAELQL